MLNYLNATITSAAITTNSASTCHWLASYPEQILMVSESTDEDFYFRVDTTASVTNTSGMMYVPGAYSLLIPWNGSSFINLLEGTSSGHIHITEFV